MKRITAAAAGLAATLAQGAVATQLADDDYENLDETARFGIVSLTNNAAANYTVNLTGILLLGLAVAAAVTFWAYLHVFFSKKQKGSGGYDDYGGGGDYGGSYRRKRSADDTDDITETLPIVIANFQEKMNEENILDEICRRKFMCEAALESKKFKDGSMGKALHDFYSLLDKEGQTAEGITRNLRSKIYFEAWKHGRYGKKCKLIYEKCRLPNEMVLSMLQQKEA